MRDYSPLSMKDIQTKPEVRQEAMRRLVRLVTNHCDESIWLKLAETYKKNFPVRPVRDAQLQSSWCTHQLMINACGNDEGYISDFLEECGLPSSQNSSQSNYNIIEGLIEDWHARAEYFRYAGQQAAQGKQPSHEEIIAHLRETGHEANIPPLKPANFTKEDLLGMMLFGELQPAEAKLFLDWWHGENDTHDTLCNACEEWMGALIKVTPEMRDMPEALRKHINRGEIGYEEARHKTDLIEQLLLNRGAMKSDGTTKYTRLPKAQREFFQRYCQEPLCYNPNGTTNSDVHPVLLAIQAHEDELAQHMIKNGAWLGRNFRRSNLSPESKSQISQLFTTALKQGSYDTFIAVLDWLGKHGVKDPITVTAQSMFSRFSTRNNDCTALFEEVIRSDHISSILPKIDYLLGHGLNPFVDEAGAKLLVPHATNNLPRATDNDAASSAEVIVGMLKRGFGRYLFNGPFLEPDLIGLSAAGSNNKWLLGSDPAIKASVDAAHQHIREKIEAITNGYDQQPDRRPLSLQGEEMLTFEDISPENIIEAFGFSEHALLLNSPRWHGHEKRFCELFYCRVASPSICSK